MEQTGCADTALGNGLLVDGKYSRVQRFREGGALSTNHRFLGCNLGNGFVQLRPDAAERALDIVHDRLLSGLTLAQCIQAFQDFELNVFKVRAALVE
ncbi:hypothetical protein D3C73_1181320 [compost metagenome]